MKISDGIRKVIKISSLVILATFVLGGCAKKEKVEVYYTTDLHSHFTKALEKTLSKRDRKNTLLLDAGDIIDIQTLDDAQWMSGEKTYGAIKDFSGVINEKISEPREGVLPIVKKMGQYGYDMATVGNHEFYGGYKEFRELVNSFKIVKVPFMSANTFYTKKELGKSNDECMSKQYLIKRLKVGNQYVKIGIIPLTTTTINDEKRFKNGKIKFDKKVMLQYNPDYKGRMYMTDMVKEATKVSNELKKKENPDVVIMVVHSGEQPKIPLHTGNRVKELAEQVPNIDFIIGGHTHTIVDENKYKGVDGRTVYYSQAGCHSNSLGLAQIYLKQKDGKWSVSDIDAKVEKFKSDKNDPEDDSYERSFKGYTKKEYNELKKKKPDIYIDYTIMLPEKDKKIPTTGKGYKVYNQYVYKDKDHSEVIYYIKSPNYDDAYNLIKKYNPEAIEAYQKYKNKN